MNIYRNESVIKRNARIAQGGLILTMVVLIGGMVLSFRNPEQVSLAFGALLLGFILFQITIYFQNRWGRKPRPDTLLDTALKGLDNRYSMYHYMSPVHHLLIGPSGIWVLLPFYQRGKITYENGRWHQKGGNLYWKIFGQESLGRPEYEVESAKEKIEKFIQENFQEEEFPSPQAALVFTDARAVIDVSEDIEAPATTVPVKDLKELIRKAAKVKSLSIEKVKLLEDALRK
jgi:hypothetical protein